MTRRTLVLASLIVGTVGFVGVAAAGGGGSRPRIHGTNFFSDCRFSHAAPDDPIAHFGTRGASHPHDFFGNTSTNALSTLRTLRAHGTTCNRLADTAAYWVPALYLNGRRVKPLGVNVYYQLRSIGQIAAFPAGLKVVAGNAGAAAAQSTRIVYWSCAYPPGPNRHVASPPRCPRLTRRTGLAPGRARNAHLLLNVVFPDCWDGKRLDSRDHRSHMAYSVHLRCPGSHPVKVPKLRLTVMYPTYGGNGLALASGGIFSSHADFFNAWNQRVLRRIVERCAAEEARCSRG